MSFLSHALSANCFIYVTCHKNYRFKMINFFVSRHQQQLVHYQPNFLLHVLFQVRIQEEVTAVTSHPH